MKTAKEYRMEAKAALSGNWGIAIVIVLVYGLISSALASVAGIGILILGGALTVGLYYAFLQLYRRPGLDIGDLFAGFKGNGFTSTIVMYLLTSIFTFLWGLLLFVPGIIASYRYSMAPYILADHPEISGTDAITASKNLMVGKKWKLFCLQLSFIGWILLGFITFGIAVLWISPWMQAAQAAFYESIKDEVILPEQI